MEPALPQAEPQTVEPFEIAFDYDDNHCSWGVDQALEDLDQQLVNELLTEAGEGRYDDDHVHELLIARAKALEAQAAELDVDDENYDENYDRLTAQAVELTDAASRLTYCTDFCCCASDDFSTESDYFDDAAQLSWQPHLGRHRPRRSPRRRGGHRPHRPAEPCGPHLGQPSARVVVDDGQVGRHQG